jgi:subtilisin family serine protease
MQKSITKFLSFLLLAALLVSPVAAAAPEYVAPPTDGPSVSAEDQAWLDMAEAAESFTVQLIEPSLATYDGGNALFAAPARSESGKLDVNSPEALAYLEHINAGLDAFISKAESVLGRELEVLYRYDYVINGFSAKMSVEEAAMLRQLPEVREIFVDSFYKLDTDVSPAFIGIDKVWDGSAVPLPEGKRGEGTILGIIDTGINAGHPSFQQTTPLDPYVFPAPAGGFKGLCATAPATHHCNNKLIGMWDMLANADGNDTLDHGSHTAGTAGGNRVQINYNGATVVISGMAPHAQIISYKVCTEGGCPGGASTAAVNQAIQDGADALNFSIGPSYGPARSPWSDSTELAFLEAFKVGVSIATSAGNSGPEDSTVYKLPPWAIVTANTQHGRIFGYPVTVNPSSANPLNSLALPASADLAPAMTTNITGAGLIWGGNHNNLLGCNAWPAGTLTGKVALIQRGDCSFKDKLQNVQDGGGVFALVYNNQPGAPIIMGTNSGAVTIPAGMISKEAGEEIVAVATSPMTVNINKNLGSGTRPEWGDILADSSSRGPIPNFEMLEPDIAAPGTNVLAAYSGPGQTDLMSGTSMAGPHVAGSMAVMRSLYPSWTPAAIRSAIIMTALAGTSQDYDLGPVTPFDYGNGRIDMSKAALAGLVMEVTYEQYKAANPAAGGDIRTLNIPSYQNSNCLGGCTFTRTVKNVAGVETAYTVEIEKTENVAIEVTPATFTIPAGGTQLITVKVTPSILSGGEWQFGRIKFATDGTFPNGKAISDTAFTLAAKAAVTGSTLPSELRKQIPAASGSHVFEDAYYAEAITAFNTTRYGMAPATIYEFNVAQDPTPENPYDDREQNWYTSFSCPSGTERMVAEILETTSPDLDIFLGTGSTPAKLLEKATSASGGSMEYINLHGPTWATGTCWLMVQNWEASEAGEDPVKLAIGTVPKTPSTNLTVSIDPTSVPKLTPFDMTVSWDLGTVWEGKEVWYGWFSAGSTATQKNDIVEMDVNLYRDEEIPQPEFQLYLPLILKAE